MVVVMQVQVCEGQIILFEYDVISDVIVVENGGFVVDVK